MISSCSVGPLVAVFCLSQLPFWPASPPVRETNATHTLSVWLA